MIFWFNVFRSIPGEASAEVPLALKGYLLMRRYMSVFFTDYVATNNMHFILAYTI
jgi:hypothetical protein